MILDAMMPLTRGSMWFATVYIMLLLTAPFLQYLFKMRKDILGKIIILISFFVCIKSTLGLRYPSIQPSYMDDYISFIWIFLIMGYYKMYLIDKININKYKALGFGMFIYILMVIIYFFANYRNIPILPNLIGEYLSKYQTLPNILVSFPIFYFFLK